MQEFGFGQETSSPVKCHPCIVLADWAANGSTASIKIAFLFSSDPNPPDAVSLADHLTTSLPMPYPFFRQSRTIYWNESFAIVQNAHARMTAENPPRFDKDGTELTSNPPGPIQWADEHPTRLTSGRTGSQHDLKPGDCPHAWRING